MLPLTSTPLARYITAPDDIETANTVLQDCVRDEIYYQMIDVYRLSAGTSLHGTALQCLGFLYRAYPTYMTEEASTEIMDKIFRSNAVEAKTMLLRSICDFLVSQSARLRDEDKGNVRRSCLESALKLGRTEEDVPDVDMRQLIGNYESFADSG